MPNFNIEKENFELEQLIKISISQEIKFDEILQLFINPNPNHHFVEVDQVNQVEAGVPVGVVDHMELVVQLQQVEHVVLKIL